MSASELLGNPGWCFSNEGHSHMLMNSSVSIVAEIPEELYETLRAYLEEHPDWDQDRVFSAAISLFLMQNNEGDRRAARVYLDSLFSHGKSGT